MGENLVESSVLLIIDPQQAFGGAIEVPGADLALRNMREAMKYWRDRGGHVIVAQYVYHSRDEVGRLDRFIPGIYEMLHFESGPAQLYEGIAEFADVIITKTRYSAVIASDLPAFLSNWDAKTVVVAGLTTPICVQTTVDDLMMANYQVVVLEDACASQAMGPVSGEDSHRAAIERMRSLFAKVVTTAEFVSGLALWAETGA